MKKTRPWQWYHFQGGSNLAGRYLFGTWLGMMRITWGKSPEWLYRNPRFTKGHYRRTANLCYLVKLRYEASQVWLNATFYSTRSAIIGLAVETWRVKTELITITILHIIIITTSILDLGFKTIAPRVLAHTKCINKHWNIHNISSKDQAKLIAK